MRDNECTKIVGTNVILVPYRKKHVERYHEWMKSEELRYFTGSEILTLAEEFQMQKRWHQDQDKCTFIILDKSIFTETENEIDQPNTAEVEIMIADVTYRRRKRGWEAIILMLLYGINKLNITKYIAKIKFDNEKSINMFEKLKFQKVQKSQIFQEYTFEKVIDKDWTDWLYSEATMDITTYEEHDKEREKEKENNPAHDL
ncbi:hypothetical protein QLX08_009639 [Tetragonisca angustula]|uniref:N-acetyltransferase domain-containing protein n=1 Tax=Tetragonisca angustula TaxID=166442 RepID=A0AAW0ZGZ3_9HYME